ncbi:MAG: hypothetical protein KBT89_16465, partial [Gammaproteobacteria bacterium]|nr:hypothetical protein [Gammaproteobacteria bacterium]
NERWRDKSATTLSKLVAQLENEGIISGLIIRRSLERRKKLMDIVKSCFIHKNEQIHYRRKKGSDTHRSEVDFLCSMGLLKNFIEESKLGNKKCSYFYGYEAILERFSAIPHPVPRHISIVVKKKGDNKTRLKMEKIPNQAKLRALEREMESFNDLLERYCIIHPNIEDKYPTRYKRIFNGGRFSARQGGRYYSNHPAFLTKNTIDPDLGGKPRDFIKVELTDELSGKKQTFPTVSFDYTVLHFNLLHLHCKGELYSRSFHIDNHSETSKDPYRITEGLLKHEIEPRYRTLVKLANMAVLGSQTAKATLKEMLEKEHNKSIVEYEDSL